MAHTDSAVLSDLSQAETLKAIKSETVYYQSGYGYEYTANDKGCTALCDKVTEDLAKYNDEIEWVVSEFGDNSASRLELVTTIIFAEREMRRKRQSVSETEVSRRVKGIKPHFTDDIISATVEELSRRGLISVESK